MQYDPEKRPSAQQALGDIWLKELDTNDLIDFAEVSQSLENLQTFRTQMTFQKAVLTYIASQQLSKGEEEDIREKFRKLDMDKDGVLSKDELIKIYKLYYKEEKKANKVVQTIIRYVDLNQNGVIDYNGNNIFTFI